MSSGKGDWKLSFCNGFSEFRNSIWQFCLFALQFIDVGTMLSPTIYARRSLSYLMNDMPQEALNDAVQAQVISPVWHIASYLQTASLLALGRENEAQVTLKEGSALETKRRVTSWEVKNEGQHSISFTFYLNCSFVKDEHNDFKWTQAFRYFWQNDQGSKQRAQSYGTEMFIIFYMHDWFICCQILKHSFCNIIGWVLVNLVGVVGWWHLWIYCLCKYFMVLLLTEMWFQYKNIGK